MADRRCAEPECTKFAQGATNYCIGHGGGARCSESDCTKAARYGGEYCSMHGGGHRCAAVGCVKGAQGKTEFCKKHGGGSRCAEPDCTKSAVDGQHCRSHGGGRRCAAPDCGKSAQGKTNFCSGHGGGRRCAEAGCVTGAAGSTDFCITHGGGQRCFEPGCARSVIWPTNHCTTHHPDYIPGTCGIKPTDSVILYLGTDLISGLRFFGIVKVNDAFKLDRLNAAIHHYHSNDARIEQLFYAIMDGTNVERSIKAITGRPTGRFHRVVTESLFDHQMPEVMSIIGDHGLIPVPMP